MNSSVFRFFFNHYIKLFFYHSLDVSTVEKEYIRNLQQQIYFLELECDYLRDQANKVVEVPNHITLEADKLIKKLKVGLHNTVYMIIFMVRCFLLELA